MAILTVICSSNAMASGNPLKVYMLAGQSNMHGLGHVKTFDYLGCAKTHAQLGKAFAEAMLEMQKNYKHGK